MAYLKQLQKKQQGVVLITALIMVIAVTGIAVTLMSSSSIDIKITNAAQEREVAENEVHRDHKQRNDLENLYLQPVKQRW